MTSGQKINPTFMENNDMADKQEAKEIPGRLTSTLEQANGTARTLDRAYEEYLELKQAMERVEAARAKLVGSPYGTARVSNVVRKYWPSVIKIGTAVAAGGGVSAFVAGEGAFSGLLKGFASLFGGG